MLVDDNFPKLKSKNEYLILLLAIVTLFISMDKSLVLNILIAV